VRRSVSVSWSPDAAFRRFTSDFGSWWPRASLSVGTSRVKQIVFETHVGGRIYEEHVDGRRFLWGTVSVWEPPRRVQFTWHPSREPKNAQDVELLFVPEGTGTRLELTSSGWERWDSGNAKGARRGYDAGWGYVLNTWAGRRAPSMVLLELLFRIAALAQRFRGGLDAAIGRARGEIGARSRGT
jgi:uncharacterized protein YndB with AHSA1/START domain